MDTKDEHLIMALKATLHLQVNTTTSGLQHNATHRKDPMLLQMKCLHFGSLHPNVLERSDGTTTTPIVECIYEMLVKLIDS